MVGHFFNVYIAALQRITQQRQLIVCILRQYSLSVSNCAEAAYLIDYTHDILILFRELFKASAYGEQLTHDIG